MKRSRKEEDESDDLIANNDAELVEELIEKNKELEAKALEEGSRRVNLDRENRELKAFIFHYCMNSSSNKMSATYADPMIGMELSHFREEYLKILSRLGEMDKEMDKSRGSKVTSLENENGRLLQILQSQSMENLKKLISLRDQEILELKKELEQTQEQNKALTAAKEEASAKLFMLELQSD